MFKKITEQSKLNTVEPLYKGYLYIKKFFGNGDFVTLNI